MFWRATIEPTTEPHLPRTLLTLGTLFPPPLLLADLAADQPGFRDVCKHGRHSQVTTFPPATRATWDALSPDIRRLRPSHHMRPLWSLFLKFSAIFLFTVLLFSIFLTFWLNEQFFCSTWCWLGYQEGLKPQVDSDLRPEVFSGCQMGLSWSCWHGASVPLHVVSLWKCLGFLAGGGPRPEKKHSSRREAEAVSVLSIWAHEIPEHYFCILFIKIVSRGV